MCLSRYPRADKTLDPPALESPRPRLPQLQPLEILFAFIAAPARPRPRRLPRCDRREPSYLLPLSINSLLHRMHRTTHTRAPAAAELIADVTPATPAPPTATTRCGLLPATRRCSPPSFWSPKHETRITLSRLASPAAKRRRV